MTHAAPHSALVARVFETEHTDLLGLFDRASRRGACFYRRAPDGSEMLALGVAAFEERARFPQLFRRLRERVSGEEEEIGLVGWTAFDPIFGASASSSGSAFGASASSSGSAFGASASSSGSGKETDTEWGRFSRRRLVAPEVLLRRQEGEQARAVVLASEAELDDVWTRWQSALADNASTPTPQTTSPEITWHDEERFRRGVGLVVNERIAPKVVLARRAQLDTDAPIETTLVLRTLSQAYPSCSIFALSPNGESPYPAFVGATPETLASVHGGEVETMALAGTAQTGIGEAPDLEAERELLSSKKDLDEHRFVLDMIVDALGPLSENVAAEPEPRIHRLANVSHLMTKISGRLHPQMGLAEVVDALHPTPAVCGTPRERARDLIGELEGFDRGLYAGALGWMDLDGNGEFDVAIRCGLIDEKTALLYAGAGITADSDVDIEVAETRNKFEPLLNAISEVPE